MPDPLRLAAAAIELGIARYGRRDRRTAAWLALVVVGVVCAGGGGGFAVAALLIYLIPILGAAGAALAVAGALLAIASVALGLRAHLARRSRNGRLVGTDLQSPAVQADLQSLAAGAEAFVRENKALTLAAAFIAGLLAGDEGSRSR